MRKLTLTIGIPAYNEEKNIKALLNDLFLQEIVTLKVKKIIIHSDGSDDETVKVASSQKGKYPVKVMIGKERRGTAFALNNILKNTNSDILVLLNSDIRIKDKDFLEKFCDSLLTSSADLVSCRISPLKPRNTFEKILNHSINYKMDMFRSHRSGRNVYTCFGLSRAFSKRLYKSIKFNESVGEDAYSYFYCVSHHFIYTYTSTAKVFYRIPNFIRDHKGQSVRFLQSRNRFVKEFGVELVKSEYQLPMSLLLFYTLKYFLKNPLYMILYFGIFIGIIVVSKFSPRIGDRWDVARSSKNLESF